MFEDVLRKKVKLSRTLTSSGIEVQLMMVLSAAEPVIQGVPLATEPGISIIIPTPMKILQRNVKGSTFVVWGMKRNVSVVRLILATRSSGPPASKPAR